MKEKLSVPEQISHMKNSGILFDMISESEAEKFVIDNTYYFKIKSYAKNFPKNKIGKYINLNFVALKELSTLDMYLRRIIMITTLNIEHAIRTNINYSFCNNNSEDGYSIVKAFRSTLQYTDVRKNNYTESMINKYDPDYAIWNYMEVISFGTLIEFYQYYYNLYGIEQKRIYPILYAIRLLRNISAHNNCVLNNLVQKKITPCEYLKSFIAKSKIFSDKQLEKLRVPVIHDFAAMLFAVNYFCKSRNILEYTYNELYNLADRIDKHIEYFDKHLNIKNNLLFFRKLVDFLRKKAYNTYTEQKS